MVWTGEHRGFTVRAYFENNRSVITTQRAFRRRFFIPRNNAVPNANTIRSWVKCLEETGSTLRRGTHGRRKSVRTPENVQQVREAVEQSPSRSARKHAVALGMSDRSVRRILKLDLKFHPYKIMLAQELSEADYASRRDLCEQMLARIPPAASFMSSDEAHFHLNGAVNKQNFRYWSENNPRLFHEKPLHSPKLTVWCAVTQFKVIGPYFFEEEGVTVTVNSERYVSMLQNFLEVLINQVLIEEKQLKPDFSINIWSLFTAP